jgi:hypothetical protein
VEDQGLRRGQVRATAGPPFAASAGHDRIGRALFNTLVKVIVKVPFLPIRLPAKALLIRRKGRQIRAATPASAVGDIVILGVESGGRIGEGGLVVLGQLDQSAKSRGPRKSDTASEACLWSRTFSIKSSLLFWFRRGSNIRPHWSCRLCLQARLNSDTVRYGQGASRNLRAIEHVAAPFNRHLVFFALFARVIHLPARIFYEGHLDIDDLVEKVGWQQGWVYRIRIRNHSLAI